MSRQMVTEVIPYGETTTAVSVGAPIDVSSMHLQMEAMRSFVKGELVEGVHYGKVPGISKNFLQLPGAEQIFRAFNCRPIYSTIKEEIDFKTGHVFIWRKCQAENLVTGVIMGEGDAMCHAGEFLKRDGSPGDFNKVLPNVLQKADKRAFVKCARTLGCTSEFFTQDEDLVDGGAEEKRLEEKAAVKRETEGKPVGWSGYVGEKLFVVCPDHGTRPGKLWNYGKSVKCSTKQGEDWCAYQTAAKLPVEAPRPTPAPVAGPSEDSGPEPTWDE